MSVNIEADFSQSSELEKSLAECQALRDKLADVEKYRDFYRAEFVKQLKEEFGDLDVEELQKQSAGRIDEV